MLKNWGMARESYRTRHSSKGCLIILRFRLVGRALVSGCSDRCASLGLFLLFLRVLEHISEMLLKCKTKTGTTLGINFDVELVKSSVFCDRSETVDSEGES